MCATSAATTGALPIVKPLDSALGAEVSNIDLREPLSEDKFVYRHKWQVDDVLMWDNRSTMHCVMPYDAAREKRAVHRVVVKGDKPV